MALPKDARPLVAIGHVRMFAKRVASASERLETIGVRSIVRKENFAVMELRGGTHIVLRELEDEALHEASFDLMYDDLQAAHALFKDAGFEVTPIEKGKIHDGFVATAPERFQIKVNSSHVGQRHV